MIFLRQNNHNNNNDRRFQNGACATRQSVTRSNVLMRSDRPRHTSLPTRNNQFFSQNRVTIGYFLLRKLEQRKSE